MTQLAPTFGDHRGADTRVRGVETLVFRSGAGWDPAADWQSASLSFRFIASKPINNRPQDSILPHFGSCRFPIDSEYPVTTGNQMTRLDGCPWTWARSNPASKNIARWRINSRP